MQAIEHEITAVNNLIAKLKTDFEAYITDKTVSLDIRWNIFIDAPEYLKNVPDYMCSDWGKFFPNDYVMYDGPYHVDRYQFVYAADIVQHAEENLEDGEEPSFDINEAKEKILAANLHGAKYDW